MYVHNITSLVRDAGGNINSGFLEGNLFQMGSAFPCMDIEEDSVYLESKNIYLPRVE